LIFAGWYRAKQYLQALKHEYNAVQGEATMETLRRFRWVALLMLPVHGALAYLFGNFHAAADKPQLIQWAQTVALTHALTGIVATVQIALVFGVLRTAQRASVKIIALQISLCVVYLAFGISLALADLQAGTGAGISSYLLVCMVVGVVSLMRPAISMTLFALAYWIFLQLLLGAGEALHHELSLHVIAACAPLLAAFASIMIWHQYAKTVVLRRQLSASNNTLTAKQKELEYLADHDALTGLYNRREFMRLSQMELDRVKRAPCDTCVLIADIDFFKKINDQYGHPAGDAVLQQVAKVLQSGIRTTDVLARLGGEEFMVLLPNTSCEGAGALAEKLRANLCRAPVQVQQNPIPVSASFGVSVIPRLQSGMLDDLYAAADQALYRAKQRGRNRVEIETVTSAATRGVHALEMH
jgi:diguanylate cyclase (GGDEF)-like protein